MWLQFFGLFFFGRRAPAKGEANHRAREEVDLTFMDFDRSEVDRSDGFSTIFIVWPTVLEMHIGECQTWVPKSPWSFYTATHYIILYHDLWFNIFNPPWGIHFISFYYSQKKHRVSCGWMWFASNFLRLCVMSRSLRILGRESGSNTTGKPPSCPLIMSFII